MGKGSGSTRASSSRNPRGLITIREEFYDEDTGEIVMVERQYQDEPRSVQLARAALEKYEAQEGAKLRQAQNEAWELDDNINDIEKEIRDLNRSRRILLSDMEQEESLFNDENPRLRDEYGRRLDDIDRQISSAEGLLKIATERYNKASAKFDRMEAKYQQKREQYLQKINNKIR